MMVVYMMVAVITHPTVIDYGDVDDDGAYDGDDDVVYDDQHDYFTGRWW